MKHPSNNLRNGLKWRANPDGTARPRWEPSPAARQAGIRGRDLKDLQGAWIEDRGLAISLCDDRLQWVRAIRAAQQAGQSGLDARQRLAQALDMLPAPKDELGRLRRGNVADLIEIARALGENRPAVHVRASGPTMADLVAEYLADPPRDITASTLDVYRLQVKKILARWASESIHAVTAGRLHGWYHDELLETHSPATANQVMGTLGALYKWAGRKDWIKPGDNPVRGVGMIKPEGRLVMWPFALERAAVAWCDANNFEDVADMIVYGCWIGARQIDLCAASLGDLAGDVWHYTPIKTKRKGLQAMPGLLPPVKERLARRRAALGEDGYTYLRPEAAPLLFDHVHGMPHTSKTIGFRFDAARDGMMRAAARGQDALKGIGELCLRDTRDTCVTRIFYAENMEIAKIAPWTGHSIKSAERILREHYIVLQKSGALATGDRLLAYARAQGWS